MKPNRTDDRQTAFWSIAIATTLTIAFYSATGRDTNAQIPGVSLDLSGQGGNVAPAKTVESVIACRSCLVATRAADASVAMPELPAPMEDMLGEKADRIGEGRDNL